MARKWSAKYGDREPRRTPDPDLIYDSASAAARETGWSASTLQAAIKDGSLVAERTETGRYRISDVNLEMWESRHHRAIEDHIARLVAEAPPPSQESIDAVRALFRRSDAFRQRQTAR